MKRRPLSPLLRYVHLGCLQRMIALARTSEVCVMTTPDGTQSTRLLAGGTISEPGVGWRFADPLTVFGRWSG